MNPALPSLATLQEVADALQVSPHSIRAWVRKGKLHPVRICRRLLFDPAEVHRLVAFGRGKKNDEVVS